MSASLLEVERIAVHFRRRAMLDRAPIVRAVNDVSLTIERGETYGLVGESGSGKSTVARAVLQLVSLQAGSIRLLGRDINDLTRKQTHEYRRRVQAVLQDPFSSLSAFRDVETSIGDALTRHFGLKGAERRARVIDLLDTVGLSPDFAGRYVHEMSGGQCQRVALARALAVEPDLIVCDEPTSALDVSIQSKIINLLRRVQHETDVGYLFISHDLEVVRHVSDRVGTMYLGYLLETGAPQDLYEAPAHPYTEMLAASIPTPHPILQRTRRVNRREVVADAQPPSPMRLPPGCPLASRCPAAMEVCRRVVPPPTEAHHGGTTRCHLHSNGPRLAGESVVRFMQRARQPDVIRR